MLCCEFDVADIFVVIFFVSFRRADLQTAAVTEFELQFEVEFCGPH